MDINYFTAGLAVGFFVTFFPQMMWPWQHYGRIRVSISIAGLLLAGFLLGHYLSAKQYRYYTGYNGTILYRCNLRTGETAMSVMGKPWQNVEPK